MKRFALVVAVLGGAGLVRADQYFPRVEIASGTISSITGTVTVTGPVTDTELRASPVDVSATEVSISTVGTSTTIEISTSAWTLVPAASSLSGRNGLTVSVPSTNNANIVAHPGNCISTAVATTVRPYEVAKGNGFTLFPFDNSVCLWALSLHTSTESVHVVEIAQ